MSDSRIDVVLRLRALEERRALGELARAERVVAQADEVVEQAERIYAARPWTTGSLSPLHLRALQLQGVGALELVQEAMIERSDAVVTRDDARATATGASIRRKSAERLADRRREEAAVRAQRAADRALDELVLLQRTVSA